MFLLLLFLKVNGGGLINQTRVHSSKGIKLDSILFLIVYICRNKMIPNTCIFRLLTLVYYQKCLIFDTKAKNNRLHSKTKISNVPTVTFF
jgi:hypothetical protein